MNAGNSEILSYCGIIFCLTDQGETQGFGSTSASIEDICPSYQHDADRGMKCGEMAMSDWSPWFKAGHCQLTEYCAAVSCSITCWDGTKSQISCCF